MFTKGLQLDSQNADLLHNLGNCLKMLGRMEDAIVCLNDALDARPNFAEALSNLVCGMWHVWCVMLHLLHHLARATGGVHVQVRGRDHRSCKSGWGLPVMPACWALEAPRSYRTLSFALWYRHGVFPMMSYNTPLYIVQGCPE